MSKSINRNSPMTDTPALVTRLQKSMSQEEWLRRYQQRFIDRAGLSLAQAKACARAESFEVLSEWFEDDPECAADMEMSYWSD